MKTSLINFLNAVKTASISRKTFLKLHINTQIVDLLKILYKENYILSFKIVNTFSFLAEIHLKTHLNTNIFQNLKIYSIKAHGIFFCFKDLNRIIQKNTFFLLSTIAGLKSLEECKRLRLGGKILFSL